MNYKWLVKKNKILKDADVLKLCKEIFNELGIIEISKIRYENNHFAFQMTSNLFDYVQLEFLYNKILFFAKTKGYIVEKELNKKPEVITKKFMEYEKGLLLIDELENYDYPINEENKTLCDIKSTRYVLNEEVLSSIVKLYGFSNYDFRLFHRLFRTSDIIYQLDNFSTFKNTFETHMRLKNTWANETYYINQLNKKPNVLINGVDYSHVYSTVENKSLLKTIKDSYDGIINENTINVLDKISLGTVSEAAFFLRSLLEIDQEEEKVLGKKMLTKSDLENELIANELISSNYGNFLIDINDRESILNVLFLGLEELKVLKK